MTRSASFLVLLLAGCLPPPPDRDGPDGTETDAPDTDCEPSAWFVDGDGDGFGSGAEVQACAAPADHVAISGDCDDADGATYPGAPDPAGDPVDADCDGNIGCADLDCDGYADLAIAAFDDLAASTVTAGIWIGDASGISDARHRPISQVYLSSVAAGDLDGDGTPDLAFSQLTVDGGETFQAATIVIFGPEHSTEEIVRVPSTGARGVDLADFDGDGDLEMVVAQNTDGESVSIDSVVLARTGSRYEWAEVDALPTEGARAVLAEDFDADGFVDVAFANEQDGASFEIDSWIYWGSASGFSTGSRTALATSGACGLAAADLDGDGDLDLVVANRRDDAGGYDVDSLIFWNDGGFTNASVTKIPTHSARDVAAGDLDRDGAIDLVFAIEREGTARFDTTSTIYWNAAGAFSAADTTDLATQGANAVELGDADGDGHTDVLFANAYGDDEGAAVDSIIYWGASARAFDARPATRLDTNGASALVICPGGERCR